MAPTHFESVGDVATGIEAKGWVGIRRGSIGPARCNAAIVEHSVVAVGEVAGGSAQRAEVDEPVAVVVLSHFRTGVALGEYRRGASRSQEGECEEGGADSRGHRDLS